MGDGRWMRRRYLAQSCTLLISERAAGVLAGPVWCAGGGWATEKPWMAAWHPVAGLVEVRAPSGLTANGARAKCTHAGTTRVGQMYHGQTGTWPPLSVAFLAVLCQMASLECASLCQSVLPPH